MTEKWSHDAGGDGVSLPAKEDYDRVADNLRAVVSRIEEAKQKYGIKRDITLCAATKTVDVRLINHACELGLRCMGENKVQELCDKYDFLDSRLEKQFIGSLQKNKAKYIVGRVSLIQSLDGISLAEEIAKQAKKHGIVQDCLVEINIGEEENKGGVMPRELPDFLDAASKIGGIRLAGLMTVGPAFSDETEYRPYFERTYRLLKEEFERRIKTEKEPVLSMGMSGNFDIAIACGATTVRPGTAIFGARYYPPKY